MTDVATATLERLLGGRPVRCYPAVVSTEADALAWARAGGPHGAVVVAEYQASPRGRAGFPWSTPPGHSLGFSVLLRPDLPVDREGWLYLVAACALADVADVSGSGTTIRWPDTVERDGTVVAQVAVQTDVDAMSVRWAVVSVLVADAASPRGPLLARAVEAIEARRTSPPEPLLADATARCSTIGRRVRARLVPMGPRGIVVEGRASRLNDEGSLVVETDSGRVQPVRPQDLGVLEVS